MVLLRIAGNNLWFTLHQVEMDTGSSCKLVSQGFDTYLTPGEKIGISLVSDSPLTNTEWKESFTSAADTSASTFERMRKALVSKGYVERDGEGRGARYRITATGKRALGVKGVRSVS